ncbi:MAG: hypothetical protein FJ086_03435 [Deltaproteobacteria bacterium]|nr:hypothetical protein [Deltaproteobacteria bacterium]
MNMIMTWFCLITLGSVFVQVEDRYLFRDPPGYLASWQEVLAASKSGLVALAAVFLAISAYRGMLSLPLQRTIRAALRVLLGRAVSVSYRGFPRGARWLIQTAPTLWFEVADKRMMRLLEPLVLDGDNADAAFTRHLDAHVAEMAAVAQLVPASRGLLRLELETWMLLSRTYLQLEEGVLVPEPKTKSDPVIQKRLAERRELLRNRIATVPESGVQRA